MKKTKTAEMPAKLNEDGLLDYLPHDSIIAAFAASPGNEIASGKFTNPESSAALAANTFGYFIDQPSLLPPLPGTERCGWPAQFVTVEQTVPFPWWPKGRHPWLDAFVETGTHIIGIESKRYEPFRSKTKGQFSDAYWHPVWGEHMSQFEALRDQLTQGKKAFERLDAVQLIKHAFGLRTEAQRRGKRACLVYLYAEPENWPDGREVDVLKIRRHKEEVVAFADQVVGDEVSFAAVNYDDLLTSFTAIGQGDVANHAAMIRECFGV